MTSPDIGGGRPKEAYGDAAPVFRTDVRATPDRSGMVMGVPMGASSVPESFAVFTAGTPEPDVPRSVPNASQSGNKDVQPKDIAPQASDDPGEPHVLGGTSFGQPRGEHTNWPDWTSTRGEPAAVQVPRDVNLPTEHADPRTTPPKEYTTRELGEEAVLYRSQPVDSEIVWPGWLGTPDEPNRSTFKGIVADEQVVWADTDQLPTHGHIRQVFGFERWNGIDLTINHPSEQEGGVEISVIGRFREPRAAALVTRVHNYFLRQFGPNPNVYLGSVASRGQVRPLIFKGTLAEYAEQQKDMKGESY